MPKDQNFMEAVNAFRKIARLQVGPEEARQYIFRVVRSADVRIPRLIYSTLKSTMAHLLTTRAYGSEGMRAWHGLLCEVAAAFKSRSIDHHNLQTLADLADEAHNLSEIWRDKTSNLPPRWKEIVEIIKQNDGSATAALIARAINVDENKVSSTLISMMAVGLLNWEEGYGSSMVVSVIKK